jgi:benzoyl-CoA reductase subunit D
MITAGIDCGAKNVRALILKDGQIVGKALEPAGMDTKSAATKAFDTALNEAGLTRDQVQHVIATGSGKDEVSFKTGIVTDVGASARGAVHLFPEVRTVIDVGAEEGRAIRVDASGKVLDFAINEKCAAGAGAFTEAMARALDVKLDELGPLSLQSTKSIPMNAQCAVFAESEVVSLVHAKTPKPDMAKAIHDAISDRITSMVRRVGMEEKIALVGGVARNVGFVKSLETDLNTQVLIPDAPQFVGAMGAAIAATDN